MSVDEAELIIFILDGSGSMKEVVEPDNVSKIEYLNTIVESLLQRIKNSSKKFSFKISFIYFSEKVTVQSINDMNYFSIDEAIKNYEDPVDLMGGGQTAIADALKEVFSILTTFQSDEGIPPTKHVSILLFTDGNENIRDKGAVNSEAKNLISHPLSPAIGTISFGKDADEQLLESIATSPSERQKQHLRNAGVLKHLHNKDKLFLIGHSSGQITEEKVTAIRNFVEVLSKTIKKEDK